MRVLAGECVTRERCVRSSYGGAEAGISLSRCGDRSIRCARRPEFARNQAQFAPRWNRGAWNPGQCAFGGVLTYFQKVIDAELVKF